MASQPLTAIRRLPSRTIDAPMAAFAGLSVAFVVFAMPADLLASLIGATGISKLVLAAAPPLGLTARLTAGAFGALAAFAGVFVLLRLADRASRPRFRIEREEAPEAAPRLRRRDRHPDAPPPRPIFAARDFAPQEPEAAEEVAEAAAPTPLWLADAQANGAAPEPFDFDAADPEPEPEERPVEAPADEPEELVLEQVVAEPEAEPLPAALAEAAPAAAAANDAEDLEALVARLERGLSSRRSAPAPSGHAAAPSPPAFAREGDERLRAAIDSLQRLAARQH